MPGQSSSAPAPLRDINITAVNGTAISGSTIPVSLQASTAGYTTATSTVAALTNASSLALAANANALYRIFQNTSATITVTLGLGNTPVAGTGIVLTPNSSYEMSAEIGNMFKGIVNAITSSSTANLAVTEGV